MKEQVVAEYLSGDTIDAIRKRHRCQLATISTILREAGIDAFAIGNKRRTGKPIRKLLSEGLPKNPTDLEWAYIAGIFDGEGSLTFEYNNSLLGNYRISIAQNDKRLLEWIKEKLGAGAVTTPKRKKRKNPCSQYRLCAQRQVFQFLVATLSFLIVKKDKAEEAVKVLKRRYDWS